MVTKLQIFDVFMMGNSYSHILLEKVHYLKGLFLMLTTCILQALGFHLPMMPGSTPHGL